MDIQHLEEIKKLYWAHRQPDNAVKMAAYMKNKFPFLGINSEPRAELEKQLQLKFGKVDIADLEPLVNALWSVPEREYHYYALSVISQVKKKLMPSHVDFMVDLILQNSWWDSVDVLAPHFVGQILYNYPELRDEYLGIWIDSENIWLNRTAILFQLKYKKETDFELLCTIIDSLKHKKDFFVKKAIGWALREYSKTNPKAVESYIVKAELLGLSEREGMKHILKIKN